MRVGRENGKGDSMSRTVPHWDYESRDVVNGEWTVPCGRGFGRNFAGWEAACAHIAEHCAPCPHGDPYCPCQDGDLCHYEGPDAWPEPIPGTFDPPSTRRTT